MKKGILAVALVSIFALAASDIYAWGWGRGSGRGNGQGYGRGRGPGYGQGYGRGPGYDQRGYGRIEYLKAELGLSEKQVEKIFKINSEFRLKYYKNRDSYKKIEELRIQHRKAIEIVLTKAQKEKFNSFWNSRRYGRNPWCPYR